MKMKLKSELVIALSIATIVNVTAHGIGARVEGDQLLINDTLYEKTKSVFPTNRTIEFQYPVSKMVSYIDVSSSSNVHTDFELTHDNILYGWVTGIEVPEFEVQIRIFGIDEEDAPPNFHPVFIPNRKIERLMEPFVSDVEYDYFEVENDDDNLLALGERQSDDELVYETFQQSVQSEKPENHSVVFYYIDSFFLTYAEFITISTSSASATFSHVTSHSIKAIIHDEDVNSLDVRFRLYGYQPDSKPSDYRPMLPIIRHNDPHLFRPGGIKCPPLALIKLENVSGRMASNLFLLLLSFIITVPCLIV